MAGKREIKNSVSFNIDFNIEKETLTDAQNAINKIFTESHDLKIDFASFKVLEENVVAIEKIIDQINKSSNPILASWYRDPSNGVSDIYPSVQKMFDNLEVQFLDGSIEKGFENIFKKVKVQPVISGQILSNEPVHDSGYIQDDPYPVSPSKQPDAGKDFPGDISQYEMHI